MLLIFLGNFFLLILQLHLRNVEFLNVMSIHFLGFLHFLLQLLQFVLALLDLVVHAAFAKEGSSLGLNLKVFVLHDFTDEELAVANLADVALLEEPVGWKDSLLVATFLAEGQGAKLAVSSVFI